MDLLWAFGRAVRIHRESQGISQEELAHRAQLDRTYISGIERGVRNPSLKSIARVAAALDVALPSLFTTVHEIGMEHTEDKCSPASL